MTTTSRLLPLCAGLALGAGGAWGLRQATLAPDPRPTASAPSASEALPSPLLAPRSLLVLPPRLSPAEADAALDAWLALPPLPAKASPSEIADRSDSLRALLTVLPTPQFDRLLAALGTRLGEAERGLRWIAFDIWHERDAPAAARWAAALVPSEAINAGARSRYAAKALLLWADSDFPAAYAWATALPDADFSRSLASQLLAKLAATDPVRALALAQAAGPDFLHSAQEELFRAWSDHDPAAALRALGPALLEDDQNEWHVQQALQTWAARDPAKALDWLGGQTQLGPDKTSSLLRTMAWRPTGQDGKTDPRPFADALVARPDIGSQFELLSTLLHAWATKAPDAALAWLDSIPDAAQRADLLERATTSYFTEQPAQNLPLALRLPTGATRDARVADILANWAKAEPDAALAWLRDHDDPSLAVAASRVEGTLVAALAATDPAAALARWQELPAGESRSAAVPAIAAAWAGTDPAAAARWLVAQLPSQPVFSSSDDAEMQNQFQAYEAHNRTLSSTVSAWLQTDPLGALQWVESLPDAPTRHAALHSLVNPAYSYEADIADHSDRADLLTKIQDPALRADILSRHLNNWLRSDLPAAREWIETHDTLSPEQAARILANAGVATP